jgi:hypothetical protein
VTQDLPLWASASWGAARIAFASTWYQDDLVSQQFLIISKDLTMREWSNVETDDGL